MEQVLKKGTEIIDRNITIPGLKNVGRESIDRLISSTKTQAEELMAEVPTWLGMLLEWLFVIPLTLFFLFKDGEVLKRSYFKLVPNSYFEQFYSLVNKFNSQLGDYIFAKFFEALLLGLMVTTGLLILDVRFSVLLGIVAGVTNIIPYLGPVLGALPGILVVLVEAGSFDRSVGLVAILYLVINIIDMGIIFPVLVSRIVNLHPFIVVVSVIMGSQIMGVAGMIISVPLATAFKLLFLECYHELYPGRSSTP